MRAEHVTGDKARMVADYVTETTGATYQDGMFIAFAVLSDSDEFAAGIIISNYRGTDCEISVGSETPAAWRPNVMQTVFGYVFETAGCVRCTSITTKRNKRARDFLEALGFALEGNLRLGYDGKRDALVYGLLGTDCRYLGGSDGEEKRPGGTAPARSVEDGAGAGDGEPRSGDYASEPEPDRSVHAAG